MSYIEVKGGRPLSGTVSIQGSKNAVLPVLAGAILHAGKIILHNCPKITDVDCMIRILESLSCIVHRDDHTLTIDTTGLNKDEIPERLAGEMRSSIIFLGALLGRKRKAKIPYPGGCLIGKRPIDLHLLALKEMDADILEDGNLITAQTECLRGTEITLRFPSVGATENILMAAVFAEGTTVISGAAREPEIVTLCQFLRELGADIRGEGSSCIEVEGVKKLHDAEFTIPGDRIVAGTYMAATALTGGKVTLRGIDGTQLLLFNGTLRDMGCQITYGEDNITIEKEGRGKSVPFIKTGPYPQFPTDLQSQLMAVLIMADGVSEMEETIFEDRFQNIDQFRLMGADITATEENRVRIQGVDMLTGTSLTAGDLRGGAALVIAGLKADQITRIEKDDYIKRGYEDICRDLRELGADIRYVSD